MKITSTQKLLVIITICLICLVLMLSSLGCEDSNTKTALQSTSQDDALNKYDYGIDLNKSSIGVEMAQTEQNQRHLTENQPAHKIDWSIERDNLNRRIDWVNGSKNRVSYIYLINYGKVMAFYTLKGKVSSVNSKLTTNQQVVNTHNNTREVLESPDLDGSYGSNGEGIFFFTTDGAYVEWKGDYCFSDKPYTMTTQPELVRYIK